MHTIASKRYHELRISSHAQQNWCTMMLVKELRERHPKAKSHALMVAKAVDHMEFSYIKRTWISMMSVVAVCYNA